MTSRLGPDGGSRGPIAEDRRFRSLFEGTGTGIAVTDLTGRFVDANPAYLGMLGYTLEELQATDFLSITHPDDRDSNVEQIQELLDGRFPSFAFEKRYLAKHGRVVWVRATVSLLRDEHGRPEHLAATTEDVTAIREAEQGLRRSERLRRLAGRLAHVGGWSIEAEDHTVYWSEEVFRILDVEEGEEPPPLEVALDLYPPPHRERLEAAIAACLADGTPFDLDMEIDTFTGRRIDVRATAEAEYDDQGRVLRVVGAFQDVTELRRATREAEAAVERVTTTLESMTDAFFTLDRQWRFSYLNARAAEVLQRDRDELIGRNVWEEFPAAVGSEVDIAYHDAMEHGRTQIIEEYHYPPLDIWFEVNAYPSEQGVAVYFRDITRLRADRLALQERERTLTRQAALLDQAQDAILVRDLEGRITYWNASAARIYGWTEQEAVGRDVRTLLYDRPEAYDEAVAAVMSQGVWAGELAHRTRDGGSVTVAGRWSMVTDETGQPTAVLAINTDITERRQLEQQLFRAQRLESIGTLASGVAHDLNNVLSPIRLAADLLRQGQEPAKEGELLDTIASSAQRGSDLVTQVLSFARGADGRRQPFMIGDVVGDVAAIVRDTFPRNLELVTDIAEEPPAILGDTTQIQQVLLNLAVNARDAMPDGGRLSIRVQMVEVDQAYAAVTPDARVGTFVRIEVEDTGVGMAPEVLDRVFEPFYTTKPHGAGTGLGLSTSVGILQSHGGFLHVYSEPGAGTTFRLYLPPVSDEPGSRPAPVPEVLQRGEGELVLVADDEASVRAMTRQALETYGYRVIEAVNGAEAVARYAEADGSVDLVLTDMMMPVMDGPAAIHAIYQLDPDAVIVGASGLHGNGKVAKAAAAGVAHFIPKPYSTATLLDTLADALRRGAGADD